MYEAIVIDDEKWVIKSLLATIKDQNYFTVNAEFYDGISGLEYIRAHQPDLAFVDVRIPGIGGLDILQTAHAENLRTLFIMISGHAEFAYAQKAIFHNAIGYCLKPFSHSELNDAMEKAYQILKQSDPPADTAPNQENSTDCPTAVHLTSGHKSVKMMIAYAEQNYQKDISIQDLAEHCSINANYASQIFKQETGISFVSFLTTLRIEHASRLLSNTDMPIFEIAEQSGYSDYYYFTKVFKKAKGVTPSAYRKAAKEGV